MQAGRLNEFVEIWRNDTTINEFGEREDNKFMVNRTRAKVRIMGGSRTVENSETVYTSSVEFTFRSYVPVQQTDWIEWQGNRYRITNLQRRREWNDIVVIADKVND